MRFGLLRIVEKGCHEFLHKFCQAERSMKIDVIFGIRISSVVTEFGKQIGRNFTEKEEFEEEVELNGHVKRICDREFGLSIEVNR